MTLTHAMFPTLSRSGQVILVLAGTAFIAVAAQISVPMFPVPMTLQTLAILIVGLTFGSRLGLATLVAYLAEGAVGLPVFAGGHGTLAYMMGPTGGFLLGFVGMAWLAGLAVEKGIARGFVSTAVAAILISALIYIPGLIWPAAMLGKTAAQLWSGWMMPFLAGDVLKAVIAALIVTSGWAAVRKTD